LFASLISEGLVAERSRSIWPSVILHALWNITMLAITARSVQRPPSGQAAQDALDVTLVLAAIALSSVVVLRVLPRLDHFPDRGGPRPMLDAQEAA
jgi:membrane protease YdiL (CAAX protease family)